MATTSPAQPSGERLALLYRLSQAFNSSLDLDEVLNRVMDEVIAATRAERGFVMLREPDGGLSFRAARGMARETIDDPQFQISRSVVKRVADEGGPVLTSDAQIDERFSMRRSIQALGLRSILCVPLSLRDRVTGVVYVDNRLQAGIFLPDDLALLAAIASSAAIAIENARLYQVAVEQGRLERELQVAREVQASLLPRETPQIPGWDLAACWKPAREVAGDYYDFVPGEAGRLGLVIGDVSDKGMAPALFMALTRSIVRASLGHAPSPAEGIAHANRLLCADATGGMFVTLFCALICPGQGKVTYVNAGHNPPLWVQRGGGTELAHLTRLPRTGMALGVLPEAPLAQRTVHLAPGDLLLLYTDGVIDALNPQGQALGMERLEQVLGTQGGRPAAKVIQALEGAIARFAGDTPQFDDIAMVAVRRV